MMADIISREEEAKYYSDKATIETGKNRDFIEGSEDKETACKMLRVDPKSYDRYTNENPTEEKQEEDMAIAKMRENYDLIREAINKFVVMNPDYHDIIALWIIGTYFHRQFRSYPLLHFNAMKGSGKTRTVGLITNLSWNGTLMTSPTEAGLFRTAGTLGIDEFEKVGDKEQGAIRQLLNCAYKKGLKIIRMKKKKTPEGEEQVKEEFEPYRPIVMANIYGMEEVLGDRCISIILEKSKDNVRTKLIEDYDNDEIILQIKENFKLLNTLNTSSDKNTQSTQTTEKCSLCNVVSPQSINIGWNDYIMNKYTDTHTTHYTHTTIHTENTPNKFISFFNKIDESEIYGRNLELFMPLFQIAYIIDKDFLVEKVIKIAKSIIKDKDHEEEIENKDILLIEFVSQTNDIGFNSVKLLCGSFRVRYDISEEWINARWFGRALKRLNLISEKRRTSNGIEVVLNFEKAKEKIKMFKPQQESNTQ